MRSNRTGRTVMRFVGIMLVLGASVFGGYSPGIRSNPDLDRFILRIACRHALEVPRSFYSKPMHASEILAFLDKADSLAAAGLLTAQESFQLASIRRIISGQRSLVNLKKQGWDTENYLNLSLTGDGMPYYREGAEVQLKGIINPRLTGATGNFSYFSEVGVWTEYRSDSTFPRSSYQPFDGNPYNLNGRVKASSMRSSDLFRGGISYAGKRFDLETAVDYLRMGPATYYPLTFSGEYSPLTYVRVRMDLSAFEYVHTFGMLRMQRDRPKYFYTHRLDFPLFKNRLMVGINEVIINGSTAEKAQKDSLRQEYYGVERDWEWVYMMPFIPYKFAEHYLGDRDNGVLSFDVCLFYPSNVRWYAEFLLDDIASRSLFSAMTGVINGHVPRVRSFSGHLPKGILQYRLNIRASNPGSTLISAAAAIPTPTTAKAWALQWDRTPTRWYLWESMRRAHGTASDCF